MWYYFNRQFEASTFFLFFFFFLRLSCIWLMSEIELFLLQIIPVAKRSELVLFFIFFSLPPEAKRMVYCSCGLESNKVLRLEGHSAACRRVICSLFPSFLCSGLLNVMDYCKYQRQFWILWNICFALIFVCFPFTVIRKKYANIGEIKKKCNCWKKK